MDLVNNILIEVLVSIGENERKNIKMRQSQGIEAVRKRNVKFGRLSKAFPEDWPSDYKLWKDKKVTAVSLIKKYGMASSTFYKKVEQWESRTDSQ